MVFVLLTINNILSKIYRDSKQSNKRNDQNSKSKKQDNLLK